MSPADLQEIFYAAIGRQVEGRRNKGGRLGFLKAALRLLKRLAVVFSAVESTDNWVDIPASFGSTLSASSYIDISSFISILKGANLDDKEF